jgi:hypothetical protein
MSRSWPTRHGAPEFGAPEFGARTVPLRNPDRRVRRDSCVKNQQKSWAAFGASACILSHAFEREGDENQVSRHLSRVVI